MKKNDVLWGLLLLSPILVTVVFIAYRMTLDLALVWSSGR
jgi:hypothetical protein